MQSKILFVYEGIKPEVSIMKSIEKHIIRNFGSEVIVEIFENNIYELWAEMQEDPFLDLIGLLKEKSENAEFINTQNRMFSQIYLFFDYDGHDRKADDNIILKMLAHFDNETEEGKLYISYPMSEALKHFDSNEGYCKCCTVEKKDLKTYKNLVASQCYKNDILEYDFNDWILIIKKTMMKLNCMLYNETCIGISKFIPSYELVEETSETIIFNQQLKKMDVANEIYVLSGYPFFIVRNYGEKFYNKFISD